ncbi:MAG: hypothetical protein U0T69_06575 [Chitinophagales bacterium]
MNSLEIQIVKPKKLWYDIHDIFLNLFVASTGTAIILFILISNLNEYLLVLPVILILGLTFVQRRRFGWIIKNYTIIGRLRLSDDVIEEIVNDQKTTYYIKDLERIKYKHQFYQNHNSGFRLGKQTFSGIGFIELKLVSSEFISIDFILINQAEFDNLNLRIRKWKENGLSVWT